jgi:dTDP-4-amino-4,6-dideoxygalactose transaminase
MPVHQVGLPADLDRFTALAARHGLHLVEDAACALGSRYKGRPVGGDGDLACFSFHPRKVITTGEGGVITTNSDALAERLRLLRQHGMSVSDAQRHVARQVVLEDYLCVGYNYRMTDVQAAVGLEQMKKLDGIVRRRRQWAARYTEALAKHLWLRPPFVPGYAETNFQSYAVRLTDDAPLSRNDLMQRLLDEGIATRRGVMLAHHEAPYRDTVAPGSLPHSERASAASLLLPLYPQMEQADWERVVGALNGLASRPLGWPA